MGISRLKGIDGLRVLCALLILWGHLGQNDFCQWDLQSIPLPDCCAYVFFIISGFLAGYRSDTLTSHLAFYKKKANRVLPLYYLYLFITLLVFFILGRSKDVIDYRLYYYLCLLPQVPFCSSSGIIPLVHLWFIGTIVLFYFLFPFFLRINEKRRIRCAAIISIVYFFIKLLVRLILGKDVFLYRLIGVSSFDILFLGVWAGLLYNKKPTLLSIVQNSKVILFISWGLFLTSGLFSKHIPAPIRPELICCIALLIIITLQSTRKHFWTESRLLRFLGSISYEIYVIHILIIILLSDLYMYLNLDLPELMIYLFCTIVVIITAWLFNRLLSLIKPHYISV